MKLTTFNDIVDKVMQYYNDKGSAKGLSTGWPAVDEYFTLRKGQLHVCTGIPSSGKSEWLDQLMMHSAALHDWHWTVFSPENWPLEAHFQKLAEKYIGKPMFAPLGCDHITPSELEAARDFLSSAITFLEPTDKELSIDALLEGVAQCDEQCSTDAFLLDPWNECEHHLTSVKNETTYISEALSKLRNFGRKRNIAIFVVAHPTKLQKLDTGNYPVPTPYDISGSANWRNKADVCLSIWRDYQANDGVVQLHIQKMRNKNLGQLGRVDLHWLWTNGIFTERRMERDEGDKAALRHIVR